MSAGANTPQGNCRVVGGAKLMGAIAPEVICREVERAIAIRDPKVSYTIDITAISTSRLAANVTVNGRREPVQNFAVMDNNLSQSAIKHFAESLADIVVRAAKP